MSKDDEFRAWRWDREFFNSGQSKLTVQRHGHEVSLDRYGVSVDGQRVVREDLKNTPSPPEFDVREDGTVMYRQTEVAAIAPPDGWKPGEVTVYGKNGPSPREKDEAERQRRDEGHRAAQRTQQDPERGQEIAS